jgi:hypothetical protein
VGRSFEVVAEGTLDNANARVLGMLRDDIASGISQLRGDDSELTLGLLLHRRWSRESLRTIVNRLESVLMEMADLEVSPDEPGYSLSMALYQNQDPPLQAENVEIRKSKSRRSS